LINQQQMCLTTPLKVILL